MCRSELFFASHFLSNIHTHTQQNATQSQANQSGDELHYAELAISRNNATGSGLSSSSKQISATAIVSTATATVAPAAPTGNYEIKYTDTKNTLPNKPPAYDYFKEPTVYAQIDHFKTLQHKTHSPSSSQTMSMSNSASAHHANPVALRPTCVSLAPAKHAMDFVRSAHTLLLAVQFAATRTL